MTKLRHRLAAIPRDKILYVDRAIGPLKQSLLDFGENFTTNNNVIIYRGTQLILVTIFLEALSYLQKRYTVNKRIRKVLPKMVL